MNNAKYTFEDLLRIDAEMKQNLINAYNNPEYKDKIDSCLCIFAISATFQVGNEDKGVAADPRFAEYTRIRSELEALGVPFGGIQSYFVTGPRSEGFNFTYDPQTLYEDERFEQRLKIRRSRSEQ